MGILPFSGAGAAAKAVGHGKEECYKNKRGSWASRTERKEGWGIYSEEWEMGAMRENWTWHSCLEGREGLGVGPQQGSSKGRDSASGDG